jgi:hypothetical protein
VSVRETDRPERCREFYRRGRRGFRGGRWTASLIAPSAFSADRIEESRGFAAQSFKSFDAETRSIVTNHAVQRPPAKTPASSAVKLPALKLRASQGGEAFSPNSPETPCCSLFFFGVRHGRAESAWNFSKSAAWKRILPANLPAKQGDWRASGGPPPHALRACRADGRLKAGHGNENAPPRKSRGACDVIMAICIASLTNKVKTIA